jgi:hypothetical protein
MKSTMKLRLAMRALLLLLALALHLPVWAQPAPGSKVWLRADVDVLVSSSAVSNWLDQSGNGNNAWMTTVARRPILVNGALNGLPIIRFNGAQSLILTTPVSHNRFTYHIVGRNTRQTETFSMILGPSGSLPNNQLRWENGSQVLAVGTGNSMPSLVSTIGNTRAFHVLTVRYDGSVFSVYRNGGLVSNFGLSTSGPWTLGQIGAWYSSYFMNGEIAEIVMYDGAQSPNDMTTTTNYLRGKYGL